jgi:hypothetical protein
MNEQMVERVARAICQSRKFECGEGACSLFCLDQLGDARGGPHGCSHVSRIHGALARAALSASGVDEMARLLQHVLECDREAPDFGMCDSRDNHGEWYQSADFAACLIAIRKLLLATQIRSER